MTLEKPDIAIALESTAKKPMKGSPLKALEDMPDESEEPMSTPSIDADESEVSAAGALRTAFKTGDDAELAKALKGFIRLCGATEEGY